MKTNTRQDWTVSDVYITDELERRSPKKVDLFREKQALQELASHMADRPEEVLPRFVELAMEMTGGIAAGVSLFEERPFPGVFRWCYLHGTLSRFENATTPRDFSPCGVTLDQRKPVLSFHPERVYDWISDAQIVVPEVLLVPLYIGGDKPLGTLWIVSENEGHFDSGHARAMTELATFVGIAIRMLSSEKKLHRALEEQETLTREMSHRIKNLFTVINGFVRVSEKSASTCAEMSLLLNGRLKALAEANSLVRRSFDESPSPTQTHLAELIERIMRPHGAASERIHFVAEGPKIELGERATNGLALVLHELATNAAKYGALLHEDGFVELTWRIRDSAMLLEWREHGGAAVTGPPQKLGFGSRLTQATIVGQLSGELNYDWRADGLLVSMSCPVESLHK